MSPKKNKVDKGPSITGVIIIAVLNGLVGAILGFVFMSSFSAKSFASRAEFDRYLTSDDFVSANKPGSAYYFRTDPVRGRSWENKRNQLLQGGSSQITISSAEINSWITSRFIPPSLDQVDSPIAIAPGVPNFSAQDDDQIYISIPLKVRAFGKVYNRTFFAKAHFSAVDLILDEASVDSARLPHRSVFMPIYEKFKDSYRFTDEYKAIAEAWQRVESVDVSSDSLKLRLR